MLCFTRSKVFQSVSLWTTSKGVSGGNSVLLLSVASSLMFTPSAIVQLSLHCQPSPAWSPFPFVCWDNYKNLSRGRVGFFAQLSPAGRLRAPCNVQVCFYYSCWGNTISSSAWFHRGEEIGPGPAIFLPIKHSKGKKWVGAIKSQNNAARFYVKRRTDGQIQEGKTSLMTCVQELRLENWQRKAASLLEYKLLCAVKRLLSGVNMGRNTQVRVKSFSPAS